MLCTERFKKEYERLSKKKSYNKLGSLLCEKLLNDPANQLATAAVINGEGAELPLFKKRIGGRSAFRIYCLHLKPAGKYCLTFVHPKTGTHGADNLADGFKDTLQDDVADAIVNNTLYQVSCDDKKIYFTLLAELKEEE